MHETLHEFCDSRGAALRVDRTAGVIREIKILGLTSRNGRRYLPDALSRAVALYEGAKVNVNHPKGHPHSPRDYQDRIGQVRNVALRQSGDEGLFGDFHFNPKHALAEQLMWDAEHAPENVGFSHNVEARTAKQGEQVLVEEILRVQSVDLVADPATTRGLFEAAPQACAPPPPSSPEAAGLLPCKAATNGREDSELLAEQAAEIAQLRAELERHRTADAKQQREQLIRRLLAEFQLPSLEAAANRDPATLSILSERFVAALRGATNDAELRTLIEDRAELVNELRRGDASERFSRPRSRDQSATEEIALTVNGVEQFVKSIRG